MPVVVVTNRIPVASGFEADFEERFRKRAGLVDSEPGFIRNEVHRPNPMKLDHSVMKFVPDSETQGTGVASVRLYP